MAEATNAHDYFQLSRISRWHVEGDTLSLNQWAEEVLDRAAG